MIKIGTSMVNVLCNEEGIDLKMIIRSAFINLSSYIVALDS